jgi:hypothetical protein
VIGDGLEVCAKDGEATITDLALEPQSLSFLVIDVDSKDKTVGMSCPPAAFCTVDYLKTLKSLLKPQGSVLAINVSARDPEMANLVFRNVQSVFGSVFVSSLDDDDENDDDKAVNVSLLATPAPTTLPAMEEVRRRIDGLFPNETVNDDLLSDLKGNDLSAWVDETPGKGTSSGGNNNKNRKKKKGKKGKRK